MIVSKQDNESSSKPAKSISDKKVTLRTVRNFMKLGRSRHPSRESRDSSTEDEGRSLITDSEEALAGGGPASLGHQSSSHANDPSTPAMTSPSTAGGTAQGYENLSQAGSTHSNASSDGEENTNNEKLKK